MWMECLVLYGPNYLRMGWRSRTFVPYASPYVRLVFSPCVSLAYPNVCHLPFPRFYSSIVPTRARSVYPAYTYARIPPCALNFPTCALSCRPLVRQRGLAIAIVRVDR